MLEQVVREKEHPLIRETTRECMEQLWDVCGLRKLLEQIQRGEILVRELYTETASPMSLPLQWSQEAAVMYDYAPTPRKIHAAVEEALQQEKALLRPGSRELAQLQAREKLPENAMQLHTLLMTEGDLAAGELDIPVEWLEQLHQEERAVYLEQGLWIAAEHLPDYQAALTENGTGKSLFILRRMLRYRGGSSARQAAQRYGWSLQTAEDLLQELCRRGEVVCQEEPRRLENAASQTAEPVYYHAQLYKRARTKTLINRREEISTCPPSSYAALLLSKSRNPAPPEESIHTAIATLSGTSFPAAAWEDLLLPQRVRGYRDTVLDTFLSKGEYFWHMEEGRIRFDPVDEIDWEQPLSVCLETLSDKEGLIVEALSRRGASFMQALNNVLPGESPYDTLLSLMEKGIVCADSFLPVRQWLQRERIRKSAARQRINARVKALHAGRWDLVRPLRPLTIQEQMNRCFDRYLILCRETAAACGLPWQEALSLLRVQEYTGQVRRGYFVEGFSGAQFIRKEDFGSVTAKLLHPSRELTWINASDPMQPWGKLLPHQPGLSFTNIPGSTVALRSGQPVALFEKQGKLLRVLDPAYLPKALQQFTDLYHHGQIYTDRKRIVVKEYPKEAAEVLSACGFVRESLDYTLYR